MSKLHNYTEKLTRRKQSVEVSPSTSYGWFEHCDFGDNCGGGLWFEGKALTDYDGVSILPRSVCEALVILGYTVEADFWPDGIDASLTFTR